MAITGAANAHFTFPIMLLRFETKVRQTRLQWSTIEDKFRTFSPTVNITGRE